MKATQKSHVTKAELLHQGREAEAAADWKNAERAYRDVIKIDPHEQHAWERLIIVYRKQNNSVLELKTVRKAISIFEEQFSASIKTPKTPSISRLSKLFQKSAGLVDKKGKELYRPGPLEKWERRKALLERKLKH